MNFTQVIYGSGLRRKLVRSHLHVASLGIFALVVALGVLLWLRAGTRKLTELRQPTAVSSLQARGGVQRSLAALRGWRLHGSTSFLEESKQSWAEEIDPAIARLEDLSSRWSVSENRKRLEKVIKALAVIRADRLRVEESAEPSQSSEEAVRAVREVDLLLSEMAASQQLLMTREQQRVASLENFAIGISIVMIVGLALLAMYEARRRSTSLMRPIEALMAATRKFAEGELHEDIPVVSHDQLGELTESFNSMRATIEEKEEAILRSNEELQRFAYIASHDLQAPLRAVSGFVQLLQRTHADRLDERGVDWINRTVQATSRMQSLIDNLLSFSRVDSQAKPFAKIEIKKAVDDALQMLQNPIAESGAEIEVGQLPELQADRSQLAQLFQNLISNGLKYQSEGVKPRVEISAEDKGKVWEFVVRDNGIGIAEEHRERIFEVFRRLHSTSQYAGTGIGLAVCRRVVERHRGRIWVESNVDGGSDFRFTISANLQQSEPKEEKTDET
ncbi:MAG: signal transduction histidine kinase [Verrucomicrobiales bacterium]|jgi:signal transduction histidine kinase